MTELDELEEINIWADLSTDPRQSQNAKNGRRYVASAQDRRATNPKWLRQLRTAKASAARIAKARAT